MPGVRAARVWRSTSGESLICSVWIRKISSRPLREGRSTRMCRSKRPGRIKAGSRISGRLVAAMMITPLRVSKPSISDSSWFRVFSRSSGPAMGLSPRALPMASSSSMKMMQGAFSWAVAKRSRTRAAPTPTNISTKSEPVRLRKRHPGLPGHGPGQQGLAGPRRAHQQHPLGDLAAQHLEFGRIF